MTELFSNPIIPPILNPFISELISTFILETDELITFPVWRKLTKPPIYK